MPQRRESPRFILFLGSVITISVSEQTISAFARFLAKVANENDGDMTGFYMFIQTIYIRHERAVCTLPRTLNFHHLGTNHRIACFVLFPKHS